MSAAAAKRLSDALHKNKYGKHVITYAGMHADVAAVLEENKRMWEALKRIERDELPSGILPRDVANHALSPRKAPKVKR